MVFCSIFFFPMPKSPMLFPTLSTIRVSVYGFMLKSLIHLDMSFIHGDNQGYIWTILHVTIQFD